ncbi:hypothetical protein GW17_00036804 [Ensete ventricosum]|nr:hypothetical protein GW17_00036804 [Ensete ventricosum]
MVDDLVVPSHPVCDRLHLGEHLHRVANDHRPLGPQYPVHLQQDVGNVTPAHPPPRISQVSF